jgi:hypothetical protein
MLDDVQFIAKPCWALLGKEAFTDRAGIEFANVKALIYGMSSHWKIMLASVSKDAAEVRELKTRLEELGLTITELVEVDASMKPAKIRGLLHSADLVYFPGLKTLPVKFEPRFRSPKDGKQAIEAIVYFSSHEEPFTKDNYYEFLRKSE